MIKKNFDNSLTMECNKCGKKLNETFSNFTQAADKAELANWAMIKHAGNWINWCESYFLKADERPRVVIHGSKQQMIGQVVNEGRRENIPGVAEGSMAEHFLLSVDPDDEMGGW